MSKLEQPETPRYATLLYDVRKKLDISFTEYILLDMIYHLSFRTGYCYKSPLRMGEDLGITKRGINKMMIRLIGKGLLERLTDCTVRVTEVYLDTQIGGNKVLTKPVEKWEQSSHGGNKVPGSGNKVPVQQGLRTTKNYSKEAQEESIKNIENELAAKERKAHKPRPNAGTKSLTEMYDDYKKKKDST